MGLPFFEQANLDLPTYLQCIPVAKEGVPSSLRHSLRGSGTMGGMNQESASLEVMSGNKLVLQSDSSGNADVLEGIASATSSLDITVSVLEDV